MQLGTKLSEGTVRATSRTVEELVTDATAALAGETAKPADRVKALIVVKAYVLKFIILSPLRSLRQVPNG